MELGTFSVSLAVQDIKASRAFYEKLGFDVIAGNQDQNWLILRHGEAKIGLFQGMFEKNILTFNPRDVRAIQAELKAQDVELVLEADPTTTGPAHITLMDPDGNPILIDQHPEGTPGIDD
jgi:lactoylglutathione lyase